VLAALLADARVDRVRSVARGDLPSQPKLVHTRADLCDPLARRALGGVDVLWHLGAQPWRSRDGRQIAVNIDGTANILGAGAAHVVLASSAAVYGAYPSNPLPITETHPPQPNAECPYAWHKLEAERLCRDSSSCAVVRLSAVVGPHADPRVRKAAAAYRRAVPALHGSEPALQFLDEDDAAGALLAAGWCRRSGVWNAATVDWLDAAALARVAGGRVVRVPRQWAGRVAELGFKLGWLPFGADRSCLLDGPLALDPGLAGSELGWAPTQSAAVALARFLGVTPGPAQTGRSNIRQVL